MPRNDRNRWSKDSVTLLGKSHANSFPTGVGPNRFHFYPNPSPLIERVIWLYQAYCTSHFHENLRLALLFPTPPLSNPISPSTPLISSLLLRTDSFQPCSPTPIHRPRFRLHRLLHRCLLPPHQLRALPGTCRRARARS